MTEQEWLHATDPQPMLEFLKCKVSDRKLRLLAAACCRHDGDLMADADNALAVETSEQFADGLVSRRTLKQIRRVVWERLPDDGSKAAWEAAGVRAWEATQATLWRLDPFQDRSSRTLILRDLFGNPFRPPPPIPASVLLWNEGLVRRLAEQAYEHRMMPAGTLDPDKLAVLADALEEAGCQDPDILGHLRQQGAAHARGCLAVDYVLGFGET
jgi:hypothetical protein